MTEDVLAERARNLARELIESGFARLRVCDAETEIELRRVPRTAAPARSAAAPPAAPQAGRVDSRAEIVTSDVVGIVRHLRPPVTEGSEIESDRDLAYVETLGIRNAVRSRGAGRISGVFVTEGQPVEYGQPLFTIERLV